jgi:14-3-3 protein epsilon
MSINAVWSALLKILLYYLRVATNIVQIELIATHPLRLGMALNFSDFYNEIQTSHNRAYHLAKPAVHDALAELNSLSEEPFSDCTFIAQLLLGSLTIWTSSEIEKPGLQGKARIRK